MDRSYELEVCLVAEKLLEENENWNFEFRVVSLSIIAIISSEGDWRSFIFQFSYMIG